MLKNVANDGEDSLQALAVIQKPPCQYAPSTGALNEVVLGSGDAFCAGGADDELPNDSLLATNGSSDVSIDCHGAIDEVPKSTDADLLEINDAGVQCDMPEDDCHIFGELTKPEPCLMPQCDPEKVAADMQHKTEKSNEQCKAIKAGNNSDEEASEEVKSHETIEADSDGEISFKDVSLLNLPSAWAENTTDEDADGSNMDNPPKSAKTEQVKEERRSRLRRSTRTKVSYEEIPLHVPAMMKLPMKGEDRGEKKTVKAPRRKSSSGFVDNRDLGSINKQKTSTNRPENNKIQPKENPLKNTCLNRTSEPINDTDMPNTKEGDMSTKVQLKTCENDANENKKCSPSNLSTDTKNESKGKELPASMMVNCSSARLPRLPHCQAISGSPSPMTSTQKRMEMSRISQEAIAKVQTSISRGDDINKLQESLIRALEEGIECRNFVQKPTMQISEDLNSLTIQLFYETGQDPIKLIVKTKMAGHPTVSKITPNFNKPYVYKRVISSASSAMQQTCHRQDIASQKISSASPATHLISISASTNKTGLGNWNIVSATKPVKMQENLLKTTANNLFQPKISPKAKIIVNTVKKSPPKRDVHSNNRSGEKNDCKVNDWPSAKRQKLFNEKLSQDSPAKEECNVYEAKLQEKAKSSLSKPWYNLSKKTGGQTASSKCHRTTYTVRTVKSPKTVMLAKALSGPHEKQLSSVVSQNVGSTSANLQTFENEYEKWIREKASAVASTKSSTTCRSSDPILSNPGSGRPVSADMISQESVTFQTSYENWFKGKTYNSIKSVKNNNQKTLLNQQHPAASFKSRVSPAEEKFLKIVQRDREVNQSVDPDEQIPVSNLTAKAEVEDIDKGTATQDKVVGSKYEQFQGSNTINDTAIAHKSCIENLNPIMDQKLEQLSTKDDKFVSSASAKNKTQIKRGGDSSTEVEIKKLRLRDSSVELRRSQERIISSVHTKKGRHPSGNSTDSIHRETRSKKNRHFDNDLGLRSRVIESGKTHRLQRKSPVLSMGKKQTFEMTGANNTRLSFQTRRQSLPGNRS